RSRRCSLASRWRSWSRRSGCGGAARTLRCARGPTRESRMLGLTTLGTFHTAISLIAVFAGFGALGRYREISTRTSSGRVFFWGTVLTCLTGFGIFQHGGFGNPHILGIVELAVLGVAFAAERRSAFGRASRYVGTLGLSLALFLHFIPATVETLTR